MLSNAGLSAWLFHFEVQICVHLQFQCQYVPVRGFTLSHASSSAFFPCLQNIHRQLSLPQVRKVLIDVLRTTRTDQDGIRVLSPQLRMVRHPAQSHLGQSQAMLLRYRPDNVQGPEVRIVLIPCAVHLALPALRVKS